VDGLLRTKEAAKIWGYFFRSLPFKVLKMFNIKNKKILALSPHTDDIELSCGGTISKLIKNNNEVCCVVFSMCEESVPEGYPKNALAEECKAATKRLGIEKKNLILKKYPVRKFNFHRQEILEFLVQIRNEFRPDIIFLPCSQSIHQDHITIYKEGLRAFKQYTCFGYELPWDSIKFPTTTFFKLTEEDVLQKVNALEAYETQSFRPYFREGFIKSLALVRGTQVGVPYAESFELIRLII